MILAAGALAAVAMATLVHSEGVRHALAADEARVLATLKSQYRQPDGLHYRENASPLHPDPANAFIWSQSVTLSALARGLAVRPETYRPLWLTARHALQSYWVPGQPGGYSVLPGQQDNPERFYDDNVWVVWAMLDAYRTTHDPEDLAVAKRAYEFLASGEDSKLGGGIYWQQRKKTEKNACINAPAAAVALQLYEITHDRSYLRTGDRLLAWTKKTLQDTDGLLFDHIDLSGKVERTKWTYNSACYARALIERYKIRHDAHDKAEALRVLHASEARWIDPKTHFLKDPGPFGQHLLDAFYEASSEFKMPEFAATADRTILTVAQECPNADGLYGEWWNGKPKPTEALSLRFLSSVLRSLLSAEASLKNGGAESGP